MIRYDFAPGKAQKARSPVRKLTQVGLNIGYGSLSHIVQSLNSHRISWARYMSLNRIKQKEMKQMEKKEIELLERIAIALEKIGDILSNDNEKTIIRTIKDDNLMEEKNENMEIDKNNLTQKKNEVYKINYPNLILKFLSDRNISVKNFQMEEEADDILDKLSIFMGSK